MREIKFRAWDKQYKRIITVNDINFYDGYVVESERKARYFDHGTKSFISAILMQYTGLTDKNGKEIYESDIILVDYGQGMKGKFIIEYHENGFFLGGKDNFFLPREQYREVIGNIYENSDLLEK